MGAIPHVPTLTLFTTASVLALPAITEAGRTLSLLFICHGWTLALLAVLIKQEGLYTPLASIGFTRTLPALAGTLLAVEDAGHFDQQAARLAATRTISIVDCVGCTDCALPLVLTPLAASAASLAHSSLLIIAIAALAQSIDQSPRLRAAAALQSHAGIVIGTLLAVLGHTPAGPIQALAHHLHIPTDARALPVAAEFPELLAIAGGAVIGVLLASQATLVAQLAGGGGFGFEQVVASHASAGGPHFLEVAGRPTLDAVDGSGFAGLALHAALGADYVLSVVIEAPQARAPVCRVPSGVLVLQAGIAVGGRGTGRASSWTLQAFSVCRVVAFKTSTVPIGIFISKISTS